MAKQPIAKVDFAFQYCPIVGIPNVLSQFASEEVEMETTSRGGPRHWAYTSGAVPLWRARYPRIGRF